MTAIKVGDRVKAYWNHSTTFTVIATHDETAWVYNIEGVTFLVPKADLTLVPPKIAEPQAGSVVWDDGVPWMRLYGGEQHGRCWVSAFEDTRRWRDFSDAVTLATPPEASHD